MNRGLRSLLGTLTENAIIKILGRYAWPLAWGTGWRADHQGPHWEYNEVDLPAETTLATLNDLGDRGWEIIELDRQRRKALMKRPRQD